MRHRRATPAAKTPAAKTPAAPATSAEPAAEPTTPDPRSINRSSIRPTSSRRLHASWSSPTDPTRTRRRRGSTRAPFGARSSGSCRTGRSTAAPCASSTTRSRRSPTSASVPTSAGNLQKRNSNGTTTTGWSGWTSAKSDVDHQRRPFDRDARRPDGPELRLELTGQGAPEGAAQQLDGARQPCPPDRGCGPRPRRRRRQPRLRAARRWRRGPVHRAGPQIRTELNKCPQGLPDSRSTRPGFIGNYPIENATAPGGADAIFIMGYDYRGPRAARSGAWRRCRASGYDIRDTVAAYAARVPASKLILGVPYYGRAWSTDTDQRPRPEYQRREVRRLDDRGLHRARCRSSPSTASATTPPSRSPGRPTTARTARGPTAASTRGASSTSTTPGPLGPSTTSSTGTTCGARGSGRLATTGPGPSCGARSSPSSSPTRCRRRCRAARSPPRGSRRTETARSIHHDPDVRDGPRQVGLPRPGGGRRVARSEPPQRHGREQDAGVHLERHGFLTRRRAGWGVSRDAVGRGRLREPVGAAVHGLRRQPRVHDRDERIARLPEPRRRRPVRFAAVGVDLERGGGRCRSCQGQGRARPARLVVHVPTVLGRHLGWPRTRRARRQGRPLHVPGRRAAIVPATRPSRTTRSSSIGRSARCAGRTVRSTRAPASAARSASTCVARRSCRSGSTAAPRSFGRSGPIARSGPESMPGTGMGGRRLARTLRRGRTRSSSGHELGRHDVVRPDRRRPDPLTAKRATTLPAMTNENAAGIRDVGRPADLRRGRQHPARSPRRSSRRSPGAMLLVVDDGSPDGTGRHRRRAGRDRQTHPRPTSGGEAGSRARLPRRVRASRSRVARRSSSRWTPTSATIRPPCRRSSLPCSMGPPTSSSGRATRPAAASWTGASAGGSCRAVGRCSRGSSWASHRHDLTGGFKAWRASTLGSVPFDGVHAGGYVFQIEMTFRASRAGARVREIPITFRDRRVGQSKMSRRIVVEALVVVVQLATGGSPRAVGEARARRR